jgi:protein TonB
MSTLSLDRPMSIFQRKTSAPARGRSTALLVAVWVHGVLVWAFWGQGQVLLQRAAPVLEVRLLAAARKPEPQHEPRPEVIKAVPLSLPQLAPPNIVWQEPRRDAAPAAATPPAAAPVAVASPATAITPSPPPVITPARFDAAYLANPAPEYPLLSRRLGEAGRVLLRVFVNAEGDAERVELAQSSGSSRLDHAALAAVRRWRFEPAKEGPSPVACWVQVPIVFDLRNA